MALDGLVLHAIVHELATSIGGRINKIHQPSGNDILMQIRGQGQNLKLLLSANPTYPRVHYTEQQFLNPLEAPMFCMLLRKYCEGGIIEAVEQVGMERIIRIQVRKRDELGDISLKTIVIEIMGRHSNLILIDPATNLILDGIHHVTPAISSYRVIMPGSPYVSPPEQHKLNPLLTFDRETFIETLREAPVPAVDLFGNPDPSRPGRPDQLDQQLVLSFSGLSPLVAKEIIHRSGHNLNVWTEAANLDTLWTSFSQLMTEIREHRYTPMIVEEASSGKSFFSVVTLTHIQGISTTYATAGDCLESFYGNKAERDTVKQRVSDLLKFLQNEKNKHVKKLEKLQDTLEDAKDADKHRILGELLTASLHAVTRGDKILETVNYYDEDQAIIRIPLDPQLTPSENAQRYFKKYTKTKNSIAIVNEQMEQSRQEIIYLETLLQQLGSAALADIEEIRDELAEQGYVRNRNKKQRKKKKQDKPALSCFTSSDGIPIYVGKNNTQNEYLTNRLSQSTDTWLHTKDIPGSHVVIRSTTFSEETLFEAASLAAYFSQAKESSQVPVDYTLIKHVHKPSGAKPGFVIYANQKTLFVTPDEALVKRLKVSIK